MKTASRTTIVAMCYFKASSSSYDILRYGRFAPGQITLDVTIFVYFALLTISYPLSCFAIDIVS